MYSNFHKSLLISCCFHEGIYSFDFSVLGILYGLQIKAPHLESDEAWGEIAYCDLNMHKAFNYDKRL